MDLDFASVTLVDPRGRLIMQERDEHAHVAPNLWGLPGGAVEPGETALETAVRELAEETGIRVAPSDLTDLGAFVTTLEGERHHFRCFAGRTWLGDDDVECHEGRQMVFVHPHEWPDLPLSDAVHQVAGPLTRWIADHPPQPSPDSTRQFAGVVLVDPRGWILMQERDEHPRIDPEKWGLSGGHLEGGEDPVTGALRELEEETGVVLTTHDLHLVGEFVVDHRAAHDTWDRMHVYAAATTLTDADIDCREGRRIVFVEPGRARTLDLTSAAAQIVPPFLDSDLYRTLAP